MTEAGRITVGIGWDRARKVFAAFDGWTKRQTGSSSSVHIKADLLDRAAKNGWAWAPPRWDARVAFTPGNVGKFLDWVDDMSGRREALLNPVDYTIHDADNAEFVGDVWANEPTGWLRVGDRVVIIDKAGGMTHSALWQITHLEAETVPTPSGRYNRTRIKFTCQRSGTVKDAAALDDLR